MSAVTLCPIIPTLVLSASFGAACVITAIALVVFSCYRAEQLSHVLNLTSTDSSSAPIAVTQFFVEVTSSDFLGSLVDIIKKDTEANFQTGVQHENLEADHKVDTEIPERRVDLRGQKELSKRWQRVVWVCECQTLLRTIMRTVFVELNVKRFEKEVLSPVKQDHDYSVKQGHDYFVKLEPVGNNLRITVMLTVTLKCGWQSEEIFFNHVFVVEDNGKVVAIEETTVNRVEKIVLDA